jgi:hypothetical protein
MTTAKLRPPLAPGEIRAYPVLPLRDFVVFPHMIVPLFVGRKKSILLAAVKDKPFGRPPSGAVLDRRCARRPHHCAGRDGRMAPPGAEQKNATKQEGKMPSDQIP